MATEFARDVWTDDYAAAGALAADATPAARYLAFQRSYAQVDQLNGNPATKPSDADISTEPDKKTGSIKITDSSDSPATTSTWKNFKFVDHKIASWTGTSGPLDQTLWRADASASSKGASVKLVAAYVTNSGTLAVIVQFSSKAGTLRIDGASFTPAGGYRAEDTFNTETPVDQGEKALTAFGFAGAKIPGKLRIEVGKVDPNDSTSSTQIATLTMTVK